MSIPKLNSIFIDAGLVLWLSLLVFAVVFNLGNQMDKSNLFLSLHREKEISSKRFTIATTLLHINNTTELYIKAM